MERTGEQKRFGLLLLAQNDDTRVIYHKLLLAACLTASETNGVRTVTIPVEDREKLLNRARQIAFYGNADPISMAADWDKHTLRPPIGGAQND